MLKLISMKKIFDILPPKEVKRLSEDKKRPSFRLRKPESKISPLQVSPKKSSLLLIIPLILIIAGVLSYFKFLKVEIKIWPETETVTFKEKLTLDTKIENPDFENKLLPGKIFEVENQFSEEFSSSGKLLKKAEGIIRLYNAFTTQPETWREGTRFVSADGKLFLSKDKISVPGAEIKNGKIVPIWVNVPVIATEPGEDYNIGPSYFSIVAFRGTPRYTKFYGESLQPMAGGGQVSQVIKEDLEMAENILTEKAKVGLKEALKSKIPAEFVFLEPALEIKILDKFSLAKAGDETEKFNFQVKAKSAIISFKKEDVENFSEKFILSQIPKGKSLYRESLKIEYLPEAVNFETGKLSLSLNFSAKIYPEIDELTFRKGFMGKSLAEVKIFLESQPEISQTEIRVFPFWVKSIPKDIEKIEIKYPLID